MTCTFGLNGYALNAIKLFLKNKPRAMRFGSLVWDEMSLAELVNFDAKKLLFEGFVDYGTAGLLLKENKEELADHALVLIFRPYRYSWIQPIACYATKGACKGELLTELMARAITVLDQNEAIVKSVVCDGAQSNKAVMKTCGVVGKYDQIVNTFVNKVTPMEVEKCPEVPDSAVNPTFVNNTEPMEVEMCPEDPDSAVNPAFANNAKPMEVQMCPEDPDSAVNPVFVNNAKPMEVQMCPEDPDSAVNPSLSKEKDVTSFSHPTTDGELIYFFIDVPHLLKCIRNNIFNVKEVQVLVGIRNVFYSIILHHIF
jgi:hypothetical protein